MTDMSDEVGSRAMDEGRSNAGAPFIWYELMTPDPEASKAFYDAVVGWDISPPVAEYNGYRMIHGQGGIAGGVLPLTDDMQQHGARPTWLGYIHVPDVDRAVSAIEQAGGRTWMAATDIPNVGRVALVTDPHAAPFYVMKPVPPQGQPDAQSEVFSPNKVGRCAWNELVTTDLQAAKDFYLPLFGWKLGDVMPMGPMGDYQFIEQGGRTIGAMFAPGDRQPAWRFCFRVANLDKSIEAVRSGGGEILFGPVEVPTGGRIIQATDPQGAFFMIIEGGQ